MSFKNSNFKITDTYITEMRETMIHRGPDGAGTWIASDSRIGLGHRRLSIIDLSDAASQPMCNEDGTLWISYNGEIYNHAEIRKKLEDYGGHCWKTDHSDTEVILHAFEQWGIGCLKMFRGMFAIALWDGKKRELWLIRDRLGIKPLYYSIHNGRIVFASEIKALLEDPCQKREVDEEALYHYLTFLTVPAPKTIFKGIRKLPAGTWMLVKENGEIREHRYWDVLDYADFHKEMSEDEIAGEIVSELRTAVRLQKLSDVPVGVFLSGGIDSSTNAVLFSEDTIEPVNTFTIGYKGDYQSYQNETQYARIMAERVKAKHHEQLLTIEDFLKFLPDMAYYQDEPIADPVCFPVYFVSKLARDNGIKVCQLGEGADELFCGYPLWMTKLKLQKLNDLHFPNFLKSAGLGMLSLLGKDDTNYYELLRRGSVGLPIFWSGSEALNEQRKKEIISARLREKFNGFTSWEAIKPIRGRFEEKIEDISPLNWMTYLDLNLRLPELLLMRVDKMSMAVGLECRVPFLDHKFVELVMGIPESVKIKNGDLKYILKKAVKGLIPDEVIDRKKQGFGVPIYEWFFAGFGNKARIELELFCSQTDFFDKTVVMNLFDKGRGWDIWFLVNFALWWKKYIV